MFGNGATASSTMTYRPRKGQIVRIINEDMILDELEVIYAVH